MLIFQSFLIAMATDLSLIKGIKLPIKTCVTCHFDVITLCQLLSSVKLAF